MGGKVGENPAARRRRRFFAILGKPEGGGGAFKLPPPPAGRGLTRALMGSGELRVLMGGGWPKGPPLRIFKSKRLRVKIQTASERSRRTLQDTIMLTLFFDLWRHRKVKKGQNVLIYSSQQLVT